MFFKSSLKYIFNKNNITRNKNYTYSLFDSEIFVFLFHGIGVVFFFNREILTSISPNCRKRNLLYAFKYCDFLLKQCKHNNSTPLIIEKRLDMWTLVSLMPREGKGKWSRQLNLQERVQFTSVVKVLLYSKWTYNIICCSFGDSCELNSRGFVISAMYSFRINHRSQCLGPHIVDLVWNKCVGNEIATVNWIFGLCKYFKEAWFQRNLELFQRIICFGRLIFFKESIVVPLTSVHIRKWAWCYQEFYGTPPCKWPRLRNLLTELHV